MVPRRSLPGQRATRSAVPGSCDGAIGRGGVTSASNLAQLSKKILVVEDDALLREAIVECISDLGVVVVEARDGLEALQVMAKEGGGAGGGLAARRLPGPQAVRRRRAGAVPRLALRGVKIPATAPQWRSRW